MSTQTLSLSLLNTDINDYYYFYADIDNDDGDHFFRIRLPDTFTYYLVGAFISWRSVATEGAGINEPGRLMFVQETNDLVLCDLVGGLPSGLTEGVTAADRVAIFKPANNADLILKSGNLGLNWFHSELDTHASPQVSIQVRLQCISGPRN